MSSTLLGACCLIIDQLAGNAMSRKCHQNAKSNIQDGTNSSCSSLGLEAANGFGCGRVASGASGLGKGEPVSTEIIYVLQSCIGKVARHLSVLSANTETCWADVMLFLLSLTVSTKLRLLLGDILTCMTTVCYGQWFLVGLTRDSCLSS